MRIWLWGLTAAVVAVFIASIGLRSNNEGGEDGNTNSPAIEEQGDVSSPEAADETETVTVLPPQKQVVHDAEEEDDEDPPTPEERQAREKEALVEAFDNLTDAWQEPTTNGVKMADVDRFVKQFASVPKDRKEECLHRALNLIPDENVMLLAGILMDKTQDKELVELVFNDILNRDEAVKKPILKQVLTDKKHPCWADAAWIEDVTKDVDVKE